MNISKRTFSDSGNEFLLAFRKGFHTFQCLLARDLLFLRSFNFNLLFERFHGYPQEVYYRYGLPEANYLGGCGYDVTYDTSGDSSTKSISDKVEDFRKSGADKVVIDYAFPGSVQEAITRADYRAEHSEGLRRYVPHDILEANHRDVVRTFIDTAGKGIFDRQRLWSTAGKFGDPLKLIVEVKEGKITVHDEKMWDAFKKIGGS